MKSRQIHNSHSSDRLNFGYVVSERQNPPFMPFPFTPGSHDRPVNTQAAPVLDTGVKLPPPREPVVERDLSTEEMLSLFDRKESLTMAYVPHFITQCVMYYLEMLVEYGRSNRISEIKKHSRMLKAVRDEYIYALRHEMPPRIFEKFLAQKDRYLELCGANLTLMYFTFGNELSKTYGHKENEPIFCYSNIMVELIEYVERFDAEVNDQIAERLGVPCKNHGDARLTAIKQVCKDIISDYPVPKSQYTELCVSIMATKAKIMVNEIYNEQ